MKTKSGALKSALKKNTMLIAFVIIVLMFEILTQGVLLVPQNVTNLIQLCSDPGDRYAALHHHRRQH